MACTHVVLLSPRVLIVLLPLLEGGEDGEAPFGGQGVNEGAKGGVLEVPAEGIES